MRLFYNIVISFVRIYMKIFWGLKIVGKENMADIQNVILAANHISVNDPPFIGSIMPIEISFLAKSELFKNKIFASLIGYFNSIPIRRGAIDRKALERVGERIKDGKSILIFPEGTRKSDKAKPGIGKIALETQTDIVPVYIKNSDSFWKCFFRKERLCIVIGKRYHIKNFELKENAKDNYREFSKMILDKINEMKDECDS